MITKIEFYEILKVRIQELQAEGVLRASLKDTVVDDFDYKEFEW